MAKSFHHYRQMIDIIYYIEVKGKRSFHYDGVLVIMAGNDALQTRDYFEVLRGRIRGIQSNLY